jgi:UDP-N-acetylglucosamine 2-epimerase
MKIVTILGARPQFIKAGTVSRATMEYNTLVGADKSKIIEAYKNHSKFNIENSKLDLYGGGKASEAIVKELLL